MIWNSSLKEGGGGEGRIEFEIEMQGISQGTISCDLYLSVPLQKTAKIDIKMLILYLPLLGAIAHRFLKMYSEPV